MLLFKIKFGDLELEYDVKTEFRWYVPQVFTFTGSPQLLPVSPCILSIERLGSFVP